ncbi:hypothetical protein OG217_14230 [Streptomyces sp. NBC_01023]|uniref:hypothetical protein n=1 Tax=Streptomyces sp. NBC_01023 TaxID=2903724 RepID=UPI0038708A1C|nr:hypothetical protein OG217_14230 [Streptomyces sp. NBC_01023]
MGGDGERPTALLTGLLGDRLTNPLTDQLTDRLTDRHTIPVSRFSWSLLVPTEDA